MDRIETLTTYLTGQLLGPTRRSLRPAAQFAFGAAAEKIPTGAELAARLAHVVVRDDEITSKAELAWKYGDQAAYERAARDATAGFVRSSKNGDGGDGAY